MAKRSYNALTICGAVVLSAILAAAASADVYVAQNIAFTANGKNPWGPGDALEVGDKFTLLDIPLNPPPPNIHVNIPTINANPVDIALQALSDALGVPLPDSLLSLKFGGSASGNAHIGFEYFASLGRLNIQYPASASLNVQTIPGGDYVQSNQPSSIGSTFEPGVTQREIPRFDAIQIGGDGYGEPVYGGLDFTDYNTPKFTTHAPKAMAKLVANGDVRAGLFTEVSVLLGVKTWRKDFNFGGPFGGPLIEVNPSGLYVAGEDTGLFSLTDPIDIPLGFGTARVTYPQLGLSGAPNAPNSPVLRGENVSEVFRVDADLEKLIPLIGPFLSGSLAGIEYELLHLTGGPVVSIYQDQTFTPNPQVLLNFSEPVFVGGQYTNVAQFPLGQPIQWSPLFSNSSEITIVPTYLLNNTFRNDTGIDISIEVELDAISFDAPFLPDPVGPLINPDPFNVSLGKISLLDEEWEIELGAITGAPITIPKFNVERVFTVGDLRLLSRELASGTEGTGDATYVLNFSRDVVGGPPREYQATVAGVGSILITPSGDGTRESGLFEANQDVVLTDLATNEQYNIGRRDFCLYGCSLQLPEPGPAFIAEDPNNPGQFLPPLYVTTLPDIPDTSVDVPNHPILGGPDTSNVNNVVEEEFGTEVVDLRDGPETTILAQSIHFAPQGDARLGELKMGFASINNSGQTTIHSLLDTFTPDAYYDNPPALYLADGSGVEKLVRVGDPAPGGGTIETSNEVAFSQAGQVNESGQTAFLSRDFVLYRAGPNEVVEIARPHEAPPEGGGTFAYIYDPAAINDSGQVAFQALVADSLTQEVALYRGDGNTLTKIARRGDPLPGMNAPLTFFAGFALNNSGKVAFTAANAGGELGVYLGDGSSLVTIGVAGGAAPNGGTFDQIFGSAALNNVDQVAFLAQVAPSPGGNPLLGLFRSDGVETVQIAWLGQPVAGQGATLSGIFNHYLNDHGQVAFLAFVASGGSEYRAVFMGDENGLLEVSRAGLAAPDGNGVFVGFSHEGVFDGLAFNNEGHVAFEARLTQTAGGTSDDDGIFLYDGTNVIQVVREGQALAGSTVVSIAELVAQGLTYGGPLNDNMQLAYTVALADGREVVARFEPSLYWRNPGNGSWDAAANWSLGIEPTKPYDVFIVAENAFTVTGPAVNRTVKSLAIGGDETASATLDLASGVTLTATNGTTIRANGVLAGYGALAGNVTSSGTIRAGGVGNAPKTTMMFADDLTLETGSILELDIAGTTPGTQFDRLAVTGAAILDGELAASLIGFTPALGNTFQLLTAAGGVSGQFDMTVTNLPDLTGNLGWLLSYGATSVNLSVVIATLGDFSANGIVGPEDFAVWKANFGSTTNLSSDANGNGIVDAADYTVWRNNLGATLPGGGAAGASPSYATTPEPSAFALGFVAICSLSICRRWRRHQ